MQWVNARCVLHTWRIEWCALTFRERWTSRSPSHALAMPRPTSVLSLASAVRASAHAKRSMALQLSSHSHARICTQAC